MQQTPTISDDLLPLLKSIKTEPDTVFYNHDNTESVNINNIKNENNGDLLSVNKCNKRKHILTEAEKLERSERRKKNRFNGLSEEQVMQKSLPDIIDYNLDILIIGINPGLIAAHSGHYYAGPGNHFWRCLFLSGFTPTQYSSNDDNKLLEHGIGFTIMVSRTTKGSADLTKCEIREGSEILKEKVIKYKPRIAAFNGKGIFETFSGKKNIELGKQEEHFPNCPETAMFVMPSSSARFAQLPRAIDKVPFYEALKNYRDQLKGIFNNDNQLTFSSTLISSIKTTQIKNKSGKIGFRNVKKKNSKVKIEKFDC